jgi:integrase
MTTYSLGSAARHQKYTIYAKWQARPITKVQEWLGHANIATTRIYDRRRMKVEDSPRFKVSY